jgi:hypothetical protein
MKKKQDGVFDFFGGFSLMGSQQAEDPEKERDW